MLRGGMVKGKRIRRAIPLARAKFNMATPRHKSAEATQVKPPKQFEAKVFRQEPAINEVAQLSAVGFVFGTHEECWTQAKALVKHPVLELKELDHVAKH